MSHFDSPEVLFDREQHDLKKKKGERLISLAAWLIGNVVMWASFWTRGNAFVIFISLFASGFIVVLITGIATLMTHLDIRAIHTKRLERLRSYDVFHTPSRQPTP